MSPMALLTLIAIILLAMGVATQATKTTVANLIHPLRVYTGASGHKTRQLNCLSWRLGVETNNLRDWKLVPMGCENYVGHYMLGKQYRDDCKVVVDAAIEYANGLNVSKDGKDVWVFDIDETTLSNLPYYARSDVLFGAIAYNNTKFNEWVGEGRAPAVPEVGRLYNTLVNLGVKAVFLSGTSDVYTQVRANNLKEAGYHTWEKLILKGTADPSNGVAYKSGRRTEFVQAGYRIVGNIGDQWSDLIGDNVGSRTFKVPDPMYYIS